MDSALPPYPRRRPKVLILFNQTESETQFSSATVSDIKVLSEDLKAHGYESVLCNLEDDVDRVGDSVVVYRPVVILNLVSHMFGDNSQHAAIVSLLELYGYTYTGSPALTLATCQDRVRTKLILQNAGIAVPRFSVVRDINAIAELKSSHPMIVTQAFDDIYDEDDSRSLFSKFDELRQSVRELSTQFDLPFLIEEHLSGRRIQCILVGNQVLEILPLTEWLPGKGESTGTHAIAQLPIDVVDDARLLARRAFKATGCRDMAQIDFVYSDGALYVIDVRPVLDPFSGPFRLAAEASGRSVGDAVASVVRSAHKRLPAHEYGANPLPPPILFDEDGVVQADYSSGDTETRKYFVSGDEIEEDESEDESVDEESVDEDEISVEE